MSVEAILRELPDEFKLRMRNWVRSFGGQGQYAMTRAYTGEPGGTWTETQVPVLNGDAEDIDNAMRLVPNREREAVRLFWIHCAGDSDTTSKGLSLRYLGRRLDVAPQHAEARVRRGHMTLQADLHRLRARHHRYRDDARLLHAGA